MKTYNFIYITRDNKEKQVEINAEDVEDAWEQLFSHLPENVKHVYLI